MLEIKRLPVILLIIYAVPMWLYVIWTPVAVSYTHLDVYKRQVFGNTLILAVFPELYAIVALAATFLMGSALAA